LFGRNEVNCLVDYFFLMCICLCVLFFSLGFSFVVCTWLEIIYRYKV